MITVDLITGFLGSGKTTFLKMYVQYLMHKGENVCVLENDFGAVNVDTMVLQELSDSGCGLEMVAGACDKDCHQRRFKTKLISMAMMGYSHVVIEPSGVFDVDEFFDTLHEPPLNKWYSIGSVITIVDPTMTRPLSAESRFLLASQAAVAGRILFSHCSEASTSDIEQSLEQISAAMGKIHADRNPSEYFTAKPWVMLTDDDYDALAACGFKETSFVKMAAEDEPFGSVYFMNLDPTVSELREITAKLFADESCGKVFRVKGFTMQNNCWYEINATDSTFHFRRVRTGQPIIIVIGENLHKSCISPYFEQIKKENT